MNHTLIPRGPSGRFALLGARTLAILRNSKNVAGAKEGVQAMVDIVDD